MRLMIAVAASLLFWTMNTPAEQITLKEIGAAVDLPPQWIVTQGGDPTRRWAAFKPPKDVDANNALRCRVDRNQLPERFRSMTQAQINELQARAPLSATRFAEQMQQMSGVPTAIVENGNGLIDTSHASWAITTASETKGSTTAYYKSKVALPQTPGYGWNLQCTAVSTAGTAGASAAFIANRSVIDQYFQSFRYLPMQN